MTTCHECAWFYRALFIDRRMCRATFRQVCADHSASDCRQFEPLAISPDFLDRHRPKHAALKHSA